MGLTRLEFSPYNQVFQELMSPASLLASNAPGVNCLLIRFEDWARDQKLALKAETITSATREFVDALSAFAKRSRRPTILLVCPPSLGASSHLDFPVASSLWRGKCATRQPRFAGSSSSLLTNWMRFTLWMSSTTRKVIVWATFPLPVWYWAAMEPCWHAKREPFSGPLQGDRCGCRQYTLGRYRWRSGRGPS